jgi:arabinogalactan oligomer/maltooligosaccharide transport system permease protein
VATIIALFPPFWILISSFKPQQEIIGNPELDIWPNDWTWSNYKDVITNNDYEFLHWFWNSIAIALVTTAVGVFLAATAGYALSRYRFPGYRASLNSFLITQMFPAAILLVPIFQIIVTLGLLNSKLALILTFSTVAVPFCTWMLKGYFDTIPMEIEESAIMDGATPAMIFFRIILPLAKPAVAVTALFSFMTGWNEFILASIFMEEEVSYTAPVGLRFFVGGFSSQWGYFAAGSIIVSLPVVALFYYLQKYLIAGLTAGGVKG